MIKFISLLTELMEAGRSAGATTLAIRQIFASDYVKQKYSDKLKQRDGKPRISNIGEISDKEFVDIIKNSVDGVTDVKIVGPGGESSQSSKYNTFIFDTAAGRASIVLAGKGAEEHERQERGVIQAISTKGVTKVKFNNRTITGVESAVKIERSESYRHEPYADILIKTAGGDIKISAKGFKPPSFGGGGLSGMDELNIPALNEFVEKSYEEAYNQYKALIVKDKSLLDQNLEGNPDFKDYYAVLPSEVLTELLTGNVTIGGPVDFYYAGDMDVKATVEGDTAVIDGSLYTVDEFIKKKGTFALRIRKREGSCYFTDDYNELTNIKPRKLFTKKPNGKGGTQSRALIVIASQKPKKDDTSNRSSGTADAA